MITITEQAKVEIAKIGKGLKILVIPGGCAGFEYLFEYINLDEITDKIILLDQIFTDSASQPFLQEVEIDFVDEFGRQEFVIKNKNAKSGCSCGNSFIL